MKVKICGLSTTEQVETSIDYGANYCGFILNYPKSHRFISYKKADQLTKIDKNHSKYVGVLVSPTDIELEKFSKINLDYFQIYGNFSADKIKNIKFRYKKKIIVSIQIESEKDVYKYKKFKEIADIILFDSSGFEKSLSWNFNWIKNINITKMVAGNIDVNKLDSISNFVDIVDVSGALETNKVKDIVKIKNFLKKVKEINDKN